MRRSFLEEGIYETNINMKKGLQNSCRKKKRVPGRKTKKTKTNGKKKQGDGTTWDIKRSHLPQVNVAKTRRERY